MFLRSGRDASVPQAVIRNPRSSFSSSSLDSSQPALEPRSGRERSKSDMTNPTSRSKKDKGVGSTGLRSQAPLLRPRSLTIENEDIEAGISGLPPSSSSRRRNRRKSQEPPKDRLGASGAPGDNESGSSTPTEESHSMRSRISRSPRRSFSRLSRTLESIRNENPDETLQDVRRRLASLEQKKELVLLSRKLVELEAEEAAGFPTNANVINEKISEESYIRQEIIQESKLTVPFVKPYSGLNYAQYQTFVRACEHVFRTRPTTYRKEFDKVLYGIGALEGTPSTTWYRYEEKFGRLDMGWDAFKTFLLDDLFPPEIRLRDVHKKYREARQRTGQTVHSLIRYLEELEAQMVPVTEDHQMSTILGALHPWIEAQVSSRLESPKTKNELVQLALKIEATASFRPTGAGNQDNKARTSRAWNAVDSSGGTRLAKRGRPDEEAVELSLGSPVSSRPRREEPNQPRAQRDFSKTTCYNCGQLGHISTNCELPPKEKAPSSGKA